MGRLTKYTPEIMDEILKLKGKSSYKNIVKELREFHPELELPEDDLKASQRLRMQVVNYRDKSKQAMVTLKEIKTAETVKATEVPTVQFLDNPETDNPGFLEKNPRNVCTEEVFEVLKPFGFQERIFILAFIRGAKAKDACEIAGFNKSYAWKLIKKDNIKKALDEICKIMVKSTSLTIEYVMDNVVEDIERRHQPKERSNAIRLASEITGLRNADPMRKTVPAQVQIVLHGKDSKVSVIDNGGGGAGSNATGSIAEDTTS
jgi:hypothetical protein